MDDKKPTLFGFPILFVKKLNFPSYCGAVILGSNNKPHTESLPLRENPADSLLQLAKVFKHPKGKLIVVDKPVSEATYGRIKLALRFEGLGLLTHLRAIVKG